MPSSEGVLLGLLACVKVDSQVPVFQFCSATLCHREACENEISKVFDMVKTREVDYFKSEQ